MGKEIMQMLIGRMHCGVHAQTYAKQRSLVINPLYIGATVLLKILQDIVDIGKYRKVGVDENLKDRWEIEKRFKDPTMSGVDNTINEHVSFFVQISVVCECFFCFCFVR